MVHQAGFITRKYTIVVVEPERLFLIPRQFKCDSFQFISEFSFLCKSEPKYHWVTTQLIEVKTQSLLGEVSLMRRKSALGCSAY
jgi:hypothetical protein